MLLRNKRSPAAAACSAVVLVVACGGPSFTLSPDASIAREGGAKDVASPDARDAAGRDAGGDSSKGPGLDAAKDGPLADGGLTCDVFVEKGAAIPGTGTQSDPFPTIAGSIAAVASAAAKATTVVTICVLPGTYAETDLVIPSSVLLFGLGGSTVTFLSGSSTVACQELNMPQQPCAVRMATGSALAGFTVSFAPRASASNAGDGIVTGAPVTGKSPPGLADVTVNGLAAGSGIVATGNLDIGAGVASTNNSGGDGLWAIGSGTIVVGGDDVFDGNAYHGVDIDSGTLDFGGGSASGNKGSGIRLGSTDTLSSVAGLVATGNQALGIEVHAGASLLLRTSNLSGNTIGGLFFDYGDTGTIGGLDIADAMSTGMNTFHAPTPAVEGAGFGLFLCHDPGAGTLSVAGNTFWNCPPTATAALSCMYPAAGSRYVDVLYDSLAAAASPVITPSCP